MQSNTSSTPNTTDYSDVVLLMVDNDEDALMQVFEHVELDPEVYGPEDRSCEQCDRTGETDPEARFWSCNEIANPHDWPHSNLVYCGNCVEDMVVGTKTGDFWDEAVKVSVHYRPKNVDDLGLEAEVGTYWYREDAGVYQIVPHPTKDSVTVGNGTPNWKVFQLRKIGEYIRQEFQMIDPEEGWQCATCRALGSFRLHPAIWFKPKGKPEGLEYCDEHFNGS